MQPCRHLPVRPDTAGGGLPSYRFREALAEPRVARGAAGLPRGGRGAGPLPGAGGRRDPDGRRGAGGLRAPGRDRRGKGLLPAGVAAVQVDPVHPGAARRGEGKPHRVRHGSSVSGGGRVCWSADGGTKRVPCGAGGASSAARAGNRCGARAGVERGHGGVAPDARGLGRRVGARSPARARGPRLRAEVRRHPRPRRGHAGRRAPRAGPGGGAGGPHPVPAGERQDRAVSRGRGGAGRPRGGTLRPPRDRRRDRGRRRRGARAAVRAHPGTHAPARPAPDGRLGHCGRVDGVRPDPRWAGGSAPTASRRAPGPTRRAPRPGRRRGGAGGADPGRRRRRPLPRGAGRRLGGADRQGPGVEVLVGPPESRLAEAQARAAAGVRRRGMDRGPFVA